MAPHGMMGKRAAPTEDYMTCRCVDDALTTGVKPPPVKNTPLIPVWNHFWFFFAIKHERLCAAAGLKVPMVFLEKHA